MNKFIAVAALAAVSACSKPAPAPEPEATEEAAPANIAADGLPTVGKYKITNPDGSIVTADVKEDGTYVASDAEGKVIDSGKWEQKSPELYCETSDKEGSTQVCYEEKIDENGVYVSKNPNTGEVATVERMPAEG